MRVYPNGDVLYSIRVGYHLASHSYKIVTKTKKNTKTKTLKITKTRCALQYSDKLQPVLYLDTFCIIHLFCLTNTKRHSCIIYLPHYIFTFPPLLVSQKQKLLASSSQNKSFMRRCIFQFTTCFLPKMWQKISKKCDNMSDQKTQVSLTLACPMNLKLFPLDTQVYSNIL